MGVFHSQKGRGKEDSGRCGAGKARRKSRSVATGISLQRGSGASQRKCGYGLWSQTMRKSYIAMRDDNSEWTLERIREAYEKVARDEVGRMGIVQEILRKRTDFLRRIIAPVDGMRGVTLSYICPHCNNFPVEDCTWRVSTGHGDGNNRKKKHCNWLCAAVRGPYEWRAPNRILVVQIGVNANEAKVFKAHTAPLGLCDNLINALKLLANQQ